VPVKIWYVDEAFKKYFGQKVELAIGETQVRTHHPRKPSCDTSIIRELAEKCEVKLWHFYTLLAKQGRGDEGSLLTDGSLNITHIHDVEGVSRPVVAEWDTDRGWSLIIPKCPRIWRPSDLVVSL
jgi:hypothetical protein